MDYFDPLSLRMFVAICDEQSLSNAADRMNLTASAVSKRLASLEAQIDSPLLERSRRGIKLTPAGEAMLPAARSLLQSMARIRGGLSEYALNVRGQVRVAASMSPIASSLPADLAAFLRRHGNVRVSLDERTGTDVVRAVEKGRADLGVCWESTDTRRLQTAPYRSGRFVVVAHKDHELASRKRIAFAETLQYERVTIQGGSIVQLMQTRLALDEGEALKSRVQVRTYDSACRIVAANLALAIVPQEPCRLLVKALGLRTVLLTDAWAQRRFVVCARDLAELGAPARLLFDQLATRWDGQDAAAN